MAPESGESSGAAGLMAQAEALAEGPEGVDPALDALAARLRELRIEADDVAAELRRYGEGLEGEPGRLEEVEARLEAYDRLLRKHGGSVASVLEHHARCVAERDRLAGAEEAAEELQAALDEAAERESRLAGELSEARRAAVPGAGGAGARGAGPAGAGGRLVLRGAAPARRARPPGRRGRGVHAGRQPRRARGAPARGRVGRRALAGDARPVRRGQRGRAADAGLRRGRRRRGRARPPTRSASGFRRWGPTARCCASPTCPRWPRWPGRHFRIEKHAEGDLARTEVTGLEGDEVVEELCRMMGAEAGDAGARRHAERLLAAA